MNAVALLAAVQPPGDPMLDTGDWWWKVTVFIAVTFIIINLVLMLFNLIPLAPLDGDKIADYFFPPFMQRFLEVIRPYGPIILLALLFLVPRLTGFDPLNALIGQPLMLLLNLLP